MIGLMTDEPKDQKLPAPPVQREEFDLAQHPKHTDNPANIGQTNADYRNPATLMRSLGFDPNQYMTPLQFLTAVMNDDVDLIYGRNEKRKNRIKDRGGIALNYRIACAQTAVRYFHMEMPKVEIHKGSDDKFGDELARKVASGERRVQTKRIILETVEEISPDMPLPEASYPPAFDDIQGQVIDAAAPAEGLTDYDPDRDD